MFFILLYVYINAHLYIHKLYIYINLMQHTEPCDGWAVKKFTIFQFEQKKNFCGIKYYYIYI